MVEFVIVIPGLPAQIKEEAERVDICRPSKGNGEEGTEDESKLEVVVTEGEH